MMGYDYIKQGDFVNLFKVTDSTRKILQRFKSYKVLKFQRCTDSLSLTDFNIFCASVLPQKDFKKY